MNEHPEIKVLPHSIESEEALLACLLMSDNEGRYDCMDLAVEMRVQAEWFYKDSHKTIYETYAKIHSEGGELGEIGLFERLRKDGTEAEVGGIAAIYAIQERVETTTQFKHHVSTVREKHELRRTIRECRIAIEDAYEMGDPVRIAGRLSLLAERSGEVSSGVIPASVSSKQAIERMTEQMQGKTTKGVPFGLRDLDDTLNGLQPAELTILAARPGVGKTSLMQKLMESCEQEGMGVLIFSLEMLAWQVDYRYLCMKARVDSKEIRDGTLLAEGQKRLAAEYKRTQDAKRWIVDGELDIHQIRATARRLCQKEKISLVIIDYLQIVKRDMRKGRDEAVSEISAGAKQMAKELDVPALGLAQINRESEKDGRRPRLSDLRESGSLEQDADNVLFLHPTNGLEAPCLEVDAFVAKNRNGPAGISVPLMFNKQFTRYEMAAMRRDVERADAAAPHRAGGGNSTGYDRRAMERQYGGK